MSFASLGYLVFLPLVTVLYWRCPGRYRPLLLLAASYGFYMGWSIPFALLLLGETALCYAACRILAKHKSKGLFAGLLCLVFMPLLLFKYSGFLAGSLFPDASGLFRELVLPVGISFYTFQAAAFVIDVYRGEQEPEKNFLLFALFVSFFPQLVAGPIERAEDLLPQLKEEKRFRTEDLDAGIRLLLCGFFRKICVADFLAPFADRIFSLQNPQGPTVLLGAVLFGLQIYNDFAGYSEIAMGSARLLGIRLTRNFRSPYLARSLRDFWRRWHITLNRWFRAYVYLPLGGKNRRLIAAGAVFLLSGLWHGADWTFLCWGAVHGLLYGIESLALRAGKRKLPPFAAVPLTFFAVTLAWILFRAADLGTALQMYRAILTPWHLTAALQEAGATVQAAVYLPAVLAVSALTGRKAFTEKRFSDRETAVAVLLALMIGLCWLNNLHSGAANAFIYFQF